MTDGTGTSERCYVCGEPVKHQGMMGDPDMANYENVAPNAASGGQMAPVHYRCSRFGRAQAAEVDRVKRLESDLAVADSTIQILYEMGDQAAAEIMRLRTALFEIVRLEGDVSDVARRGFEIAKEATHGK